MSSRLIHAGWLAGALLWGASQAADPVLSTGPGPQARLKLGLDASSTAQWFRGSDAMALQLGITNSSRMLGSDRTERMLDLLDQLESGGRTSRLEGELDSLLEGLGSELMIADMMFERQLERLADLEVLERAELKLRQHHDRHQRRVAPLRGALADFARALKADDSLPVSRLRAALEPLRLNQPARIYGAATPHHRPRFPQREPRTEPVVVPSYLSDDEPTTPQDSAASEDAPFSPNVLETATELGYDYARIFEFVRREIRTEWYAGNSRSPETTLAMRSGNDVDQAALLIALLRASGASARYVHGTIELALDRFPALLGQSEPGDISRTLTRAGIANEPIIVAGQVASFRLEHTWVSAHLPYANYRGSVLDRSGEHWLPLAPAFKDQQWIPHPVVLLDELLDLQTGFEQGYLGASALEGEMPLPDETLLQSLETIDPAFDRLTATGRPQVISPSRDILPASLPFEVAAVLSESALLSPESLQHVHFKLQDANGNVLMDRAVPAAQVVQQRVTLGFQAASPDDQDLILANGGLALTPPAVVRVRPVLSINGMPVLVGQGSLGMAEELLIEVAITGPGGSVSINQLLTAGGVSALYFGTGQTDIDGGLGYEIEQGESESPSAAYLSGLARYYVGQWSQAEDRLAALAGARLTYPLPGLVMVNLQMQREDVLGLPVSLDLKGVVIDAALRPVEAIASADHDEQAWYRIAALQGSLLEHRVFEQQWAAPAVSADRILAVADQLGVEVLTLDSESVLPPLPDSVAEAIQRRLNQGFLVSIPASAVTVNEWQGLGWVVQNPSSGETGYFISGQLAGGSTVTPPEDWVLEYLADALRFPYSEPANTDPLSGARIRKLPSTDQQIIQAGGLGERPLSVLVTDRFGRPVKGAQVRFTSLNPDASFPQSGGTVLIATTDSLGLAAAPFRVSEQINRFFLLHLDPSDQYATQVGFDAVQVDVLTNQGWLLADAPFRSLVIAGPPDALERWWEPPADEWDFLWYFLSQTHGSVSYRVVDAYGNAVSNATVEMSANDAVGCPELTRFRPTRFAPVGACLNQLGTAGISGVLDCGEVAFSLPTDSRGFATFDLSLSNSLSGSITIQATTAPGLVDSLQIATFSEEIQDPEECVEYEPIYPSHIGFMIIEGRTTGGVPAEAARPGELLGRPRTLLVGCINTHNVATWVTLPNSSCGLYSTQANPVISASNGGVVTYVENVHPLVYQFGLQAGPVPSWHQLTLDLSNNINYPMEEEFLAGSYFTVDGQVRIQTPLPVEINDANRTANPILAVLDIQPANYWPHNSLIWIQRQGETQNWGDTFSLPMPQVTDVVNTPAIPPPAVPFEIGLLFDAGLAVDPEAEYEVAAALNPNTPWEIPLEPAPFAQTQRVVEGFDAFAALPGQILPEVLDRFPRHLTLTNDIDVANQLICEQGGVLRIALNHAARLSLVFSYVDESGEPTTTAWTAIDDEDYEEGLHVLTIPTAELRFGDFRYQLVAESQVFDGLVEVFEGSLSHQPNRRDQLPLAHALVDDVNLFDGSLNIAREDVSLGGRGPGLRFVRSYSSHRATSISDLGYGWTHNYAATLRETPCGEILISGADGQSIQFSSEGFVDGAEQFRALRGYTGTLRRFEDSRYEYFSKDGTRFTFFNDPVFGYALSAIDDANGNSIVLEYAVANNQRILRAVTDDSGRSLQFEYEARTFAIDGRESVNRQVIREVLGPLDLRVSFEYDTSGNLIRAQKQVGSESGQVDERYDYQDFDEVLSWPDQRPAGSFFFGYRLTSVRDAIRSSQRNFGYVFGWDFLSTGADLYSFPRQRVQSVSASDGGTVSFTYLGERGLGPVLTEVNNGRGFTTSYSLIQYGAAEEIRGPIGTQRTSWNLDHMLPAWTEDANGTRREFEYDDYANRISETLIHAAGTQLRDWLYYSPDDFDRPIKNRLAIAMDYRGISQTLDYDSTGNLTSQSRGGVTLRFGYNSRGDRVTETDGAGAVRQLAYDSFGFVRHVSDALGLIQSQRWDALGRRLEQTDGEGYTTRFLHDSRGRVIETTHPDSAVESVLYDDMQGRRVEVNARGVATTYSHDRLGRLLEVSDALGVISRREYDSNGNVTVEIDANGHQTTHNYDGEDRRVRSDGPEGLRIIRTYDPVGNMLSESMATSSGSNLRLSEFAYAHPLYQQTLMRRVNASGSNAEERSVFDENGNRTRLTDANGNVTNWVHDARDRVEEILEPEGRRRVREYDGADRLTMETLNTVPSQIREWIYDVRGREISMIDAVGAVSFKQYDRRNLIIESIDPLGSVVSFEHDTRGRLIRQTGPEPDLSTLYTHDLQGNVDSELRANGQLIETDFDIRNRPVLRSDSLGQIWARDYDGNGNVRWEEDGEFRRTIHDYDGLNRRIRSDLPADRQFIWAYNVHGDVVSETNPRGLLSTHIYDELGRRVNTQLPDGSQRQWTHDAHGNVLSETNSRGFVTQWTFDGLHRRVSQIDPQDVGYVQSWAYDRAGNVLTHTDRRGIELTTSYDGENRPIEIRRGGRVQRQQYYDDAGRAVRSIDANGHTTETLYDRAGRRLEQNRAGLAITRWTYNAVGDVLTQTDPDGLTTTQTWDARQRLLSMTNAANERTEYVYDGVGNQTRKTRPSGDDWNYDYDAANRLVKVTDPLGHETAYAYDPNDNLISQTNARGHSTTFSYNALDHLLSRSYPNGVSETFEHDSHGNRVQHSDANGQNRTFSYDALDRQSEANYPAATGAEANQVTYQYDGNGNRTQVTEQIAAGGTQTSTYRFDVLDRLDREIDRFGQTTTHAYDANGNRTQKIDATGTTRYTYDDLNRVRTLAAPNRGPVQYTYSPAGRVIQIDHPDGTRTDQAYDAAGRLDQLSHFRDGEREAHYAYVFDQNGNRIEQTEDLGAGEVITTYLYDAADRLAQTERAGRVTDYVLDQVGNRVEETITDAISSTIKTLSYNNRNQLETVTIDGVLESTFSYDANGNRIEAITGGLTREYNFGARDRLRSLNVQDSPPSVEWTYDDAGFRISETTPTEARRFRWDGETLSYESNILGNLLVRYDHGPDRLLAETETTQTRTWLIDGLRTPVKRLNEDGTTYSQTAYDEFGKVESELSPDIPRFGFTGHQRGPASDPDLYYAQQRYYNAATGRFLSEDPLWGQPETPLSLHRYLYAYANPTVYIDPDGRSSFANDWRVYHDHEKIEFCGECSPLRGVETVNMPSRLRAASPSSALFVKEADGSISSLEEDVVRARSMANEFGRFPYSVPPEFHSLVGSEYDHYDSLMRPVRRAEQRLDRAREVAQMPELIVTGVYNGAETVGTALAVVGAGGICVSSFGAGCVVGGIAAFIAVDQYVADKGITESSVTVDAVSEAVLAMGISDDFQATSERVDDTLMFWNGLRTGRSAVSVYKNFDSGFTEVSTIAVEASIQTEELRRRIVERLDNDE